MYFLYELTLNQMSPSLPPEGEAVLTVTLSRMFRMLVPLTYISFTFRRALPFKSRSACIALGVLPSREITLSNPACND
jgi:hypothetical protein